MPKSSAANWRPMAAYLYVLHLDDPALAWEYLRRNPAYRRDWSQCDADSSQAAHRWGLRLFEDPCLDARDAEPAWLNDPDNLIHISAAPSDGTTPQAFHLWDLPGHRALTHDGERLLLTSQEPRHTLRVAIPTTLEDGQSFAYAVSAGTDLERRWRAVGAELRRLQPIQVAHVAESAARPGRQPLMHLRALQALDGLRAGASHRDLAEVFFGAAAVAEDWYDGDLRAQIRRLVRRGRVLMLGGYRRLLQPRRSGKGRSH